jgi:conjugal transfer pilus assembly protein TraE
MNINQAAKELEARTGIKKIFFVLLACSVLANAALSVVTLTSKNTHRETLVPPAINKSFWVDGESISQDYLEQMGKFLLDLALNNTPLNCETNRSALLKYTASGSYGPLSTQTAANCKIIAKGRLSNYFSVTSISLKTSERSAVYIGTMTRWLGDKRMPDKAAAYRIKLGYSGGRIYLQELVEVDGRVLDQFADGAVKKDVLEHVENDLGGQSPTVTEMPAQGDSQPKGKP